MKAKDLRIGNLVTDEWYDSFKTVIEVESIIEKGINIEIENDGNYPELAQHTIEPEGLISKLKPIPLTKEWLLKFGFEETCYKSIFTRHKRIQYSIENKTYSIGDDVSIYGIDYVHQLQNLYFALTGEELTIKK